MNTEHTFLVVICKSLLLQRLVTTMRDAMRHVTTTDRHIISLMQGGNVERRDATHNNMHTSTILTQTIVLVFAFTAAA